MHSTRGAHRRARTRRPPRPVGRQATEPIERAAISASPRRNPNPPSATVKRSRAARQKLLEGGVAWFQRSLDGIWHAVLGPAPDSSQAPSLSSMIRVACAIELWVSPKLLLAFL